MEEKELVLKNNKKTKSNLFLAVVFTAVISVLLCSTIFYFITLKFTKFRPLNELDAIINANFYGQIDQEELLGSVMSGYIDGLGDKYATYYTSEQAENRNNSLAGMGQGMGMTVVEHPDTNNIYVVNVYSDAPADKAGICAGDQITHIDSVSVVELGYEEAVSSMVREVGSTAQLSILRGEETKTVTVEYSKFVTQTVFGKIVGENIGYIEISSFNNATVVQFKNTVDDLISKGATALIFDLRSNGGGTVNSVTQMLDYLCPEGVIMSVKYKNGKMETIAESDENEINLPMAVLTNKSTASASELFTAAIKDFGKGVSIGEKTYGKGVMQTTYRLSDDSEAVFTVAEFFPPSGVSFNEEGIGPDIKATPTKTQLKYRFITPIEEDYAVSVALEYFKNLK